MSQQLKDDASVNSLQIIGAVIAVLSLVPLVFDIRHILAPLEQGKSDILRFKKRESPFLISIRRHIDVERFRRVAGGDG